ncbi:MAG TPA: hypothetical protein VHL80_17715 [Polyangia bacterium]|nr:hypothetical protein [Polyangia bacterium]
MLFAGLLKKPITVTFEEEGTRRVVATWRVPLDRLPETFTSETRLDMGGSRFVVVEARPATRARAADSRRLTVVIRRVESGS